MDRVDPMVRQIVERGGSAIAVSIDVADRTSIGPAFDAAGAAFGPVNILVNNAGVGAGMGVLETDEAVWDELQRGNVDGPWFEGQEAARRMVVHAIEGTIIDISSILGYRIKNATAYSVSRLPLLV